MSKTKFLLSLLLLFAPVLLSLPPTTRGQSDNRIKPRGAAFDPCYLANPPDYCCSLPSPPAYCVPTPTPTPTPMPTPRTPERGYHSGRLVCSGATT